MPPPRSATLWALLAGNFVIGSGVLAPAALINDLGQAFQVDAATVGTLLAYGGALLCILSPVLAFLFNPLDRRYLLTGALVLFALGHFGSALVTDFSSLLTLRLVMIPAVACFTPQAASAVSLFVPSDRRAGAITFIFLGWSLAAAIGIPMMNLIGSLTDWKTAYAFLAAACAMAAVTVFATLPRGLRPHRLPIAAWRKVLASPKIWAILAVSCLAIAGQYIKYPYIAFELKNRLADNPPTIALLLAIYGGASILGTMLATRTVGLIGVRATVSSFLAVILLGLVCWLTLPSFLPLTGAALFIWGMGMSPAIAAQQARLIEADPIAASASTSLNTSVVYLGQAGGTMLGGTLLASGQTGLAGTLAVLLLTASLGISLLLHRRHGF
ncbi:MFS transporter [Desulfobulbus sp.]|uniref:MFS transporter n=1 Tax=Desulfobulbus sp. TaxID=895 RepID=UPI00286F4C88|nr:MFS transporter [Desulfobulbus sp.]